MDVSLATNPDGSETLLLRQGDKSEGALAPVSVPTGMPLPTTPAPTLAKNDPFFEQDTIAKNEFERMKGQDLAALAGHTPADAVCIWLLVLLCCYYHLLIDASMAVCTQEFTRVVVQDSAVIPGHTTYATYVVSYIISPRHAETIFDVLISLLFSLRSLIFVQISSGIKPSG